MNSSIWAVWAAQGSMEKKWIYIFLSNFWGCFFPLFVGKKYLISKKNIVAYTYLRLFFLLFWAAQTGQIEEFMFQNVAFRPTVYKTRAVTT